MPPEPLPADLASCAGVDYPDCVPTLTDGVVTLRAHRPQDAPRIVAQCQDPDSQAFLPIPSPYGLPDAHAFLDKVAAAWLTEWGTREWAITDAIDPSGQFLGSINLHERSPHRAEVGFGLHPEGRGRGLAARAVRLLAARAFAEGAEVLRWRAVAGNWGSRRVAWACGFQTPTTVHGGRLDRDGRPGDEWHAVLHSGEPLRPRNAWLVAPEVCGDRVRLREFREDDERWLPTERDVRAARFLTRGMPTRARYAAWLTEIRAASATGDTLQWAVADRHTDEVVGAIVLRQLAHPRTHGTAVLGYWLLPHWRGLGLMADSLELVVETALRPAPTGLGLRALRAVVDSTNTESARVLRAAGFVGNGRERAAYTHAGEPPADAIRFDLLATDDRAAHRIRPLVAPVIETERLRLRPWRDCDRPDPADDPDAAALRFMPAGAQPTHATFAEWLARKRRLCDEGSCVEWCIAHRETDRPLGAVSLFHRGDGPIDFAAELGYWVLPSARGHHYVGEALPHLIEHAFRPRAEGGLGVTRVHAGADADNEASLAILRRAGLREWGNDRQAWRRADGSLSDGSYVELLATDPR